MLRAPLTRVIVLGARCPTATQTAVRTAATTPAKAPEKIEVFVDDVPVMVEPGTTVLQVRIPRGKRSITAQLLQIVCLF